MPSFLSSLRWHGLGLLASVPLFLPSLLHAELGRPVVLGESQVQKIPLSETLTHFFYVPESSELVISHSILAREGVSIREVVHLHRDKATILDLESIIARQLFDHEEVPLVFTEGQPLHGLQFLSDTGRVIIDLEEHDDILSVIMSQSDAFEIRIIYSGRRRSLPDSI